MALGEPILAFFGRAMASTALTRYYLTHGGTIPEMRTALAETLSAATSPATTRFPRGGIHLPARSRPSPLDLRRALNLSRPSNKTAKEPI